MCYLPIESIPEPEDLAHSDSSLVTFLATSFMWSLELQHIWVRLYSACGTTSYKISNGEF